MDLTVEVTDADAARSIAYRLLSWGYVYPEKERWSEWLAWKRAVQETFEQLGLPVDDLLTELDRLPQEEDERLLALQVAYTRLFINAVPSVVAPPYASAYVDEGLLMGRPAEAAVRAYRRAGLDFSLDKHELPDHAAVELEFMYYLARKELEARETGDSAQAVDLREQQRRFLQDHLLSWAPAWRKRMDMAERASFYRALTDLTENWLRADAVRLDAQWEQEPEGVN